MKLLVDTFGPTRFDGADGGMHFVWHLPEGLPGAFELQQRAKGFGVGVYSLRDSPAYQEQRFSYDDRIILLGYPSLSEDAQETAVRKLSRLAFEPFKNGAPELTLNVRQKRNRLDLNV